MTDLARFQAQLRASALTTYEAVSVPPFTCFINPDDPALWANYAIPDEPVAGDPSQALQALQALYDSRGRTPRFEYLADFAPRLADILTDHGYVSEGDTYLMICRRSELRSAPPAREAILDELRVDGPLSDVQEFLTVQRRAFGDESATPTSEEEASLFRTRFADLRMFAARVDGQIVAVASLTPPHDGVAEVTGVATLPAYRQRGIGTATTGCVARAAFADGLDAVFLTVHDAGAGRIYRRVGFRGAGAACAYYLPTQP